MRRNRPRLAQVTHVEEEQAPPEAPAPPVLRRPIMLDSYDRQAAREVFLAGLDTFKGACRSIVARKIETGWLPHRLTVANRPLAERWTHPAWKEPAC